MSLVLLCCSVSAQTDVESLLVNGMGYDSRNVFDSSIACYNKVLELDPENLEAMWRIGADYYRMDSLVRAADYCKRVVEKDIKHKDAYYILGSVYFAQQRYKSAEECLRKATEFGGPGFVNAWCRLGETYLLAGDTAQAEPCFLKVIENDAAFERAYFDLGEIYRAKGDNSTAISWYGKAIRKFPIYPEAYDAMAECYMKVANLKQAIDSWSKVVKMQPRNYTAFYNLAKAYYQNSEPTKARQMLERALAVNPDYPEAKTLLESLPE